MSVRFSPTKGIELQGDCVSEDAETLLQYLLENPGASVDWSACASVHTAIIQVLLRARPALRGSPEAPVLKRWIEPLLVR